MKLGLGTVQFGQTYGISNVRGMTPANTTHAIVRKAIDAGVKFLDTAPRYGEAERILGSLGPDLGQLNIVTKTPAYDGAADRGLRVRQGLLDSLETLQVDRAYGLLEHRANCLLDDDGDLLWQTFRELRDEGRIARIGVSVYSPAELDAVLERFAIDLVQIPVNVLDQRMLAGDRLKRIAERGIEIHARSAFLQGALLAAPDQSAAVPGLPERVSAFQSACAQRNLSPVEGALGFVQSIPEVDVMLVGVEDMHQLEEVLASATVELDPDEFNNLSCDDPVIVDPSRWGTTK